MVRRRNRYRWKGLNPRFPTVPVFVSEAFCLMRYERFLKLFDGYPSLTVCLHWFRTCYAGVGSIYRPASMVHNHNSSDSFFYKVLQSESAWFYFKELGKDVDNILIHSRMTIAHRGSCRGRGRRTYSPPGLSDLGRSFCESPKKWVRVA